MDRESTPGPPAEVHDPLVAFADIDEAEDLPRVVFMREVAARGLPLIRTAAFDACGLDVRDFERVAAIELAVVSHPSGRVRKALLRLDGGVPALLSQRRTGDQVSADLAGHDGARLAVLADGLRGALAARAPRDSRVEIAFWSAGNGFGPQANRRRLVVPELTEVIANYPARVRRELRELARLRPGNDPCGRLLLWHGPPGTGKTWALRALAREWREWCRVECVTDPERFFGGDSGYMLEVLLGEEDDGTAGAGGRPGWRLLVLEDTGELLAVDARREVGTAFARMLNVIDGLLGQGARTLLLITTNEPPASFHPALLRPGRRLAQTAFVPLEPGDARRWLADRGCAAKVDSPATIAELHAVLAGAAPPAARRSLGFA